MVILKFYETFYDILQDEVLRIEITQNKWLDALRRI